MSLLDNILEQQGMAGGGSPAPSSLDEQLLQANNELDTLTDTPYQEPEPTTYEKKAAKVEAKAVEKKAKIDPPRRDAIYNRDGSERPFSQFGSLDNGYTNYNGKPIQNQNKIYNSYNTAQLQELTSKLYDQRIYRDKETGEKYQMLGSDGTRTPYEGGQTGFIYGGNSKTDPNRDKFGYSAFGVEERYTPGLARDENGNVVLMPDGTPYGWESGRGGIDAENAYMNWELPDELARQYEGIIHGNKGSLEARTMFDDGTKEAALARKELGSGASEYYDDRMMALLGRRDKNGEFYDTPRGGIWKQSDRTNDGTIGENTDIMKSAALGIAAEGKDLATTLFKGMSPELNAEQKANSDRINSMFGITPERNTELQKSLDNFAGQEGDFMGSGRNFRDFIEYDDSGKQNKAYVANRDMFTGVNPEFRAEFGSDMKKAGKALAEDNYAEWAKYAVPNTLSLLAESIPEMAAIMTPGVIYGVIGKRVNSYANEYKARNNGQEMSAKDMAMVTLLESINLFSEKVGMKFGGKYIKDKVKELSKDKLWKRIGQAVGATGVATAFEGLQERGEYTSEEYMTQNQNPEKGNKKSYWEVGSSDEADMATATGMLLGGAMSTAAHAGGAAASIPGRIQRKREETSLNDYISNMSDAEFEMTMEDLDSTTKLNEDHIVEIDNETKALDKINTIEDLDAMNKDGATAAVRKHTEDQILNSDETLEREDAKAAVDDRIELFLEDDVSKATLAEQLGLDQDATDTEIVDAFHENYIDNTREIFSLPDGSNEIVDEVKNAVLAENQDSILADTKEQTKKMLEFAKKRKQQENEVNAREKERSILIREEQRGKRSYERSNDKIKKDALPEIENEKKDTIKGALQALYSVIPGTASKRKQLKKDVKKALTGYSDGALNKFIKSETTEDDGASIYADMAEDILSDREASRQRGVSTTTDYDTDVNYDKETDTAFSLDPSKKSQNYQKIKRLVSQDNLYSKKEAKRLMSVIDSLESQGSINSKQTTLLKKRLAENTGNIESGENDEYKRANTFETETEIRKDIQKANKKLGKLVKNLKSVMNDNGSTQDDIREVRQAIGELKTYVDSRAAELDAVMKVNGSKTETKTEEPTPEPEQTQEETTQEEVVPEEEPVTYGGIEETLLEKEERQLEELGDKEQAGTLTEAEKKKLAELEQKDDDGTLGQNTNAEPKEVMSEAEVLDAVDEFSETPGSNSTHELKANGIIDDDVQIEEVLSPEEYIAKYGNPLC